MTGLPTGEVTFLFTDIEGSTLLWEQWPDTMERALAEHDRVVRAIVDGLDGYVFTTAGDSFSVAFGSAHAALSAAIEIQRAMREPVSGVELRVRMGLHTGGATIRDGDYFGASLNRCARLTAAAHGGQVLLSESTMSLVEGSLPQGAGLLDLGVHRLRDLTEPEHIHQLCHPDLADSFPKLRSLEGPGDTLPSQLTSFVGREVEIAEVEALLREHRLVTLSGSGGAGKTRLALQVAEELVGEFPHGLRFTELAALVDDDVFVNEVAERFGAVAVTGVPLVTTIIETVGDRRMLLILDNCEQIIGHVASLARELLLGCPNLRIIATSRERLAIAGEVVYRVPSLSLPAPDVGPSEAFEFDAVCLFVDRAKLADPVFELTGDNVGDVVSICHRLDGIPLAIELAAARVRSMSPAQIAARLDERFRILTAPDRSGSQRQQTLLRTIEWSHDLLGDRERVAFRRLGIFVSDFSLEAAEQVVADDSIFEFDVVELLTSLVDKSMVITENGSGATTRYQLLESIRVFALGRLHDAAEHRDVSIRHAEYYVGVAESFQKMYRDGDLARALVGLDEEEDNFRAVLRFTLDARRWEVAARVISALGYLWYQSGTSREGRQWCRELFDADPELPDVVRAGALHSYALALATTGSPELAIEVLHEEVDLRRRLGDPARLAAALNNLGNTLTDIGDHAGSDPVLVEAIEYFREAGQNTSLALTSWGFSATQLGDYDESERRHREALQEGRRYDDPTSIAVAMGGLGRCVLFAGRPHDARQILIEARERFEELKVGPGVADSDLSLALVDRAEGLNSASARRLLAALVAPGDAWYEQADLWIAQITASLIDDDETAALLIGAAEGGYERTAAPQAVWVLEDLERTKQHLQSVLDAEVFGRCHRAGGRRTRPEIQRATLAALESFLDRVESGETLGGRSHDR
jgi:predicted ATPase/class 3 adenylate cyclase